MNVRYFLIEPKYSDPDTFCCFTVGSNRVRASIRIYADLWMLLEAASALEMKSLEAEWPSIDEHCRAKDDSIFSFQLTVLPHDGVTKILRFNILQDLLDDGAPFRADIRFRLSEEEAADFAQNLRKWCAQPVYTFIWQGD